MSVKLVLLGMLKRGPQHGYELKAHIEQEMGDWTSIAFGSIYFALKKLTEEGFASQTGKEQLGSRPSRIIYEITPEGKKEFQRLLMKTWTDHDRLYFPLDIGMFFMREINPKERIKLIRNRIIDAEHTIGYLNTHQKEEMADPQVPAEAASIFSHSYYHLEAELDWLKDVEHRMENGEY